MQSWVKKIFGFGLASLLSDLSHEMTVALVPIVVSQLVGSALAPFYLGLVASLSKLCSSILAFISGIISNKIGNKKVLIALGYAFSAIFSALVGFAHSISEVFVFRILSFTGSGLREPPRDAVIATVIEPHNYGRAFGLRSAMDTIGALIGPLVALACLSVFSMPSVFALSFIPGIIAVAAILFLTPTVPRTVKKHQHLTWWHDLGQLPRSFVVFMAILFIFDISFFDKLLLIARAQETFGSSGSQAISASIMLYAFFNLIRACSELLLGWLSDFLNRFVLLALCGCGSFAIMSFLLMKPESSLMYYGIVFALAGISAGAMTSLRSSCAADLLPSDMRSSGYGMLKASEGIASIISSSVVGFLWMRYSAWIGFSYVLVLSIVASILLLGFGVARSRFVTTPK